MIEIICLSPGELLEIGVVAGRNQRLSVELQAKFRRESPVEAQTRGKSLLIQFGKDVARTVGIRCIRVYERIDILSSRSADFISGSNTDG